MNYKYITYKNVLRLIIFILFKSFLKLPYCQFIIFIFLLNLKMIITFNLNFNSIFNILFENCNK